MSWQYEPGYNKTNKMTRAPRGNSDQLEHPLSLMSSVCILLVAKDANLQTDSKDWADSEAYGLAWWGGGGDGKVTRDTTKPTK